MSRRRVKPDELDLWNQVASTTERLALPRRSLIVDAPLQEAAEKARSKADCTIHFGCFANVHPRNARCLARAQ